MTGVKKRLLAPDRRRTVPKAGFSWIDRRFVREGFLDALEQGEVLLYFFLVAVGDKDGLSYYGDRTIAQRLKMTELDLERARRALERKDLILFRSPLYQVLSLPELAPPAQRPSIPSTPRRRGHDDGPTRLGEILDSLR